MSSHLRLASSGGGSGGGSSGSSSGRHHHHHHHHHPSHQQPSSRSNGPSGRRTLKMDMQSPTSARVANPSTTATSRSIDGSYIPGIYANHPKPLAYSHYRNSGSVASSIYSEPIHRSHPQPYKQGLFGGQRGTLSRQPPPSSTLFDDDPGIMSEAETSSTGFRRGGKARSSLPVVRTPSKTLERPLGLVFLQYRSETKRALLPNEITSMDTVKALFVRSFPKQLTMEYLDAMNVKIYIHDGSKDMFYELEDLRDIRDRSVLRLFEPNINGNGAVPSWDQDQSYFSEPEFDSDYQHQHIHKTKVSGRRSSFFYCLITVMKGSKGSPYMTYSYPVGATLPRVTRSFSPASVPIKQEAPPKPQRQSQYPTVTKRPIVVSPSPALYSPRGGDAARSSFPLPPPASYTPTDLRRVLIGLGLPFCFPPTDPTYIASPERRFVEDPYYQFPPPRSGSITPVIIDEEARFRMEHMERQLANLTGLVQKALVHPPVTNQPSSGILPSSATLPRNVIITPGAHAHPNQNAVGAVPPPVSSLYRDYIPTRDYRDRVLKPVPSSVPKPPAPAQRQPWLMFLRIRMTDRDLGLSPEMYNQLRMLQKKAKELKTDIKVLRRNVQAQAHTVRETLRDTFLRFKVVTMSGSDQWMQGDPEKEKIRRDEELYKQEVMKLEKDLSELELTVEELRSHVINKRMRVNMSDVENMALILSKSSKSVADLKVRFPPLHESVKTLLTSDVERMAVEECFLKEEPERLESALKRCKKLTGTLVTLKRLASVQEQRLPSQEDSAPPGHFPPQSSQVAKTNNRYLKQGWKWSSHFKQEPSSTTQCSIISPGSLVGAPGLGGHGPGATSSPENALDDLLNEISGGSVIPQKNRLGPPDPPKRLPSYPSTESGVALLDSPLKLHPPLPPKPTKIPPPPPPRISSKSPLVSPSIESSGGDSSESINSQDGGGPNSKLSQRHQELLRKQRQLQEQYNRLQLLQQRSTSSVTSAASNNSDKSELKKTGSESNLRAKLGLEFSAAPTGSLSNINKPLYETDIL
ncbi:hypothetical protein Ocin01_00395 [Orchesella cincta]|uniref:Actin interacting protein 3-like C-terminal domain-containing protein n=1 Tax=Orchesella cincta TaxID=48709 RepID=A0A1D2NM06_ORCCI|nr:hypothetical protein Ocin01_00395 [Orchesella cincta]